MISRMFQHAIGTVEFIIGMFVVLFGVFGFILMMFLEVIFGRSNPSDRKDTETPRCCNHHDHHRLN